MAVCAVAPAMEPAINLLWVSIFFPSDDNNFLYCDMKHNRGCNQWMCRKWLSTLFYQTEKRTNLFICHEFDGSLRSDLQNIDSISSPQWSQTPLCDHLPQTPCQAYTVCFGRMNLQRTIDILQTAHSHFSVYSFEYKSRFCIVWSGVRFTSFSH